MPRLLAPILLVIPFLVFAQNQRRVYTAAIVNPHSPVIDGRADDEIWSTATMGDDFIQFEPHNGAAPSQKTAFQIAYDSQNLYVLIHAYDTEPDKIVGRVLRRDDEAKSDRVSILIDSYHDKRTAFEFTVDAAGSKFDQIHTADGDKTDNSWDPVWYVKTSKDGSGWTAEMRIPFSQLRYAQADEAVWGLEVARNLYRLNELSVWQPIKKDVSGVVHEFGELRGLVGLGKSRRIELLPYTVSDVQTARLDAANPFSKRRQAALDGGLDGKIGLSGNLTMDFTINPDFGQVEADPSEVNLTAFETFFEEKRPFFVEGKNIFDYRLMIGDGDLSQDMLFYSRRIGRSPHYEPDLNDDEYIKAPQSTSILGACKVSGKTAGGWSIGMLDAVTQQEISEISYQGHTRRQTIEPLSNYWIGRLQKDFAQGRTSFGGMLTATNRKIADEHLNFLNRAAYTGGVDFRHQWHNREYILDVRTAFSHIRGDKEALLDIQTSSAHYFQRPDASHLHLDSSATAMSGQGGFAMIGKTGGGHWRYLLCELWRSPGLEMNDLGFMRRADFMMDLAWMAYQYWTPKWIFREFNINGDYYRFHNFGHEKIVDGIEANINAKLKNYWQLGMGFYREGPALDVSALRGGPALVTPGGWGAWGRWSSDDRKDWQVSLNGFNRWNDDGITRFHNLNATLTVRPSRTLTLSLNPRYTLMSDNWQYLDEVDSEWGTRYLLARIRQKTLAMVMRLDYCITPTLTIQFYGQPFVSAGSYREFKRITDARASRYDDRFATFSSSQVRYDSEEEIFTMDENNDSIGDYSIDKPDFNYRQFRSNLVMRWEYRPGSTLYLVWSQGRTGSESEGTFQYGRGMRELFRVYPENVFLIKFNHWFSL